MDEETVTMCYRAYGIGSTGIFNGTIYSLSYLICHYRFTRTIISKINHSITINFGHFWNHIQRGITSGLPQWYKDELAKSAFAKIDNEQG